MQILSLILSVVALGVSYYAATRAYRLSLRPCLIFYNSAFDPAEETSWTIENAGNGPALNVLIAGDDGSRIGNGSDACVVPSIPKGMSMRIGFISKRNVLAATYKDITGREYTTTCLVNRITIVDRNLYPDLVGIPIFFALRERAAGSVAIANKG